MVAYARRVRGYWIAFMMVLCLWALPTGTATAQVHVDPESAPGKEYEIPLDRVRNDAAPNGSGEGSPSGTAPDPAPAFGVGLAPRGASDERSPDRGGARSGSRDQDSRKQPSGDEAPAGPTTDNSTEIVRAAGSTGGGVGPTLTFSALGVGALLLGAAAGFVLRRRTRQGPLQG
jgi:hypothetical protein